MGWQWLSAAALAITGCGARGPLGSQTGDVPALEVTQMVVDKYFDGHALGVYVGWPSCSCTGQSSAAFSFFIEDPDFAKLQSGAMFEIEGGATAPATGVRSIGAITEVLTGGTIEFTTFDADSGATGWYDVVFAGGAASGGFSANACPAIKSCTF